MAGGRVPGAVLAVITVLTWSVSEAAAEVALAAPKQHTFDVMEIGREETLQWWELGGAADLTELGHARLTWDKQSQTGFLWNREPLKNIGSSWVVEAELKISGNGVTLYGDGMAIWMTKERFTPGSVFGHAPQWTGLAVFLDTYDNTGGRHEHKHPYISAMVNDGDLLYLHDGTGTHSSSHDSVGCSSRLRQYGIEEKVIAVRLEYANSRLTGKIVFGRKGEFQQRASYEWHDCFVINDVSIPPGYYIGVSASTGDLTDNHDVLSLRVRGQLGGSEAQVPLAVKQSWAATEGVKGDTHLAPDSAASAATNPSADKAGVPLSPDESTPKEEPAGEHHFEVDDIDAIIADTTVVKLVQEETERNRFKLQTIHDKLEVKVAALHQHLQDMLESISKTEDQMAERLSAVEQRVAVKLDGILEESQEASTRWHLPFAGLVVVLLAASGVVYYRYRHLVKTHLL